MLTGKLVRVRYARDRIIPCYLDTSDEILRATAERLIELFREQQGHTRVELEAEQLELFGDDPSQLVPRGLAKLLEDRCDFAVDSEHVPETLREAVFLAAGRCRSKGETFQREAVLAEVGREFGLSVEALDQSLFADLKGEQKLVQFKDLTVDQLLDRYNVALAQAVVLRAVGIRVEVRSETPARLRQLLRSSKFHRLVCDVEQSADQTVTLQLDGPLSLFTATQKYGLQLALFLSSVLRCGDFKLSAEVRWGPQRKVKQFIVSSKEGLNAHGADHGVFVPPDLKMFADYFQKKVADWELVEETAVLPLGPHFWIPDYRLVEKASGRTVYLEVLGFWRKSSALQHLERLRTHATEPFVVAVSEQFRVDEADLDSLPAGMHRFKQMPLPDEIVRLAREQLAARSEA